MKTRMETCPLDHEGKCDENCPFQIRERILQARTNRQTAGQELGEKGLNPILLGSPSHRDAETQRKARINLRASASRR